ncbi:MAG: hypothetical protein Q8L36_00505 [bacterium]|nr:hypothetical protein [bacterium]
MSLVCAESQEKIPIASGLFAVTRTDSEHYFPLSGEVMSKIPREKRLGRRCEPEEKGVDIYRATAEMNGEFFHNRKFELGDFAFSIPVKVAREIIPNLTERLNPRK